MSSDTSTTDDRTATTPPPTTDDAPADFPPDDATGDPVTGQATDVDHEANADGGSRSIGVTMVSTPGDGSCGIGTYARDLLDAFSGGPTETIPIDQEAQSVRHFVTLAVEAVLAPGDVVHVQHEYGLFRRDGSRYPGVLAMVFFPVLFALNAVRGKQIVVTMHSMLSPDPDEAPFRVRLFLLLSHTLLARYADHVIFLADECAEQFTDDVELDPDRYSLLPHGVNIRRASGVSREEAKRRLGFDPEDTVVGIPGYIRPPKGHDVFVEVARRLPEYEFLVAGGARPAGADFEYAASITEDPPDNVTVTGVLDDADFPVALAAPDLALLPYRVVTQSGTFNWCAAQELPVLASDQPYFERLRRDWEVLKTTPIDDPDVVANRVTELIEDDARRAALRRNIRRYKDANSFDRVAADHYRIYRHLIDDVARDAALDVETARGREGSRSSSGRDRSNVGSGGTGRDATPTSV